MSLLLYKKLWFDKYELKKKLWSLWMNFLFWYIEQGESFDSYNCMTVFDVYQWYKIAILSELKNSIFLFIFT